MDECFDLLCKQIAEKFLHTSFVPTVFAMDKNGVLNQLPVDFYLDEDYAPPYIVKTAMNLAFQFPGARWIAVVTTKKQEPDELIVCISDGERFESRSYRWQKTDTAILVEQPGTSEPDKIKALKLLKAICYEVEASKFLNAFHR